MGYLSWVTRPRLPHHAPMWKVLAAITLTLQRAGKLVDLGPPNGPFPALGLDVDDVQSEAIPLGGSQSEVGSNVRQHLIHGSTALRNSLLEPRGRDTDLLKTNSGIQASSGA